MFDQLPTTSYSCIESQSCLRKISREELSLQSSRSYGCFASFHTILPSTAASIELMSNTRPKHFWKLPKLKESPGNRLPAILLKAFKPRHIIFLPFLILISLVFGASVCSAAKSSQQLAPDIMDGSMQNVTALRGESVEFRCRIENIGKHMIAFFRDEMPPKLIAYDESVFRRTDKYELVGKVNQDEWILRIRDVEESDAGGYICQLNSSPVIQKSGWLHLKVPPSISSSSTPAAVEIREGHNVTLSCHAHGNPEPTIVWRRFDRKIIRYNGANGYGDSVHKGADLHLSRVSRKHMSDYVCVASNGIPPDETWTIKLHVLFEPTVIPQSMVAETPLNAAVARISCTVEAWPRPTVVWKFNGQHLYDSNKYATEQSVEDRYKSVHVLEIKNVQSDQIGIYECQASNDYGSHSGEIRLIEVPPYESNIRSSFNEGSGAGGHNVDDEDDSMPEHRNANSNSWWRQKYAGARLLGDADKEIRRSVTQLSRSPSNDDLDDLNGASPLLACSQIFSMALLILIIQMGPAYLQRRELLA